jgi:drug/metabolite transporter (DMT)-like permease
MLLYYLVATPAFYYAPVGEVALLIASAPLFAVLIRLVARLPVERSEIAGAALAVLGVGIMAYPSLQQARLGSQHWIGVALSLTAAVCAAAYAIGNRQLHASGRSPGAVPQALLTFCLGLVLLPFLFWEPAVHLRSASLAWVVPLGVFSTAVPTVLVAAAAHRISSVVATLINPMTAVGANVVAAIALGEVPSPSTLAGGVLVIAAIWIAMRPRLASSPKQVQTSEVPQRGDIKPPPARD